MGNNRPLLTLIAAIAAVCLCLACAAAAFGAYLVLAPQGPVTGPSAGEFSGHFTNGFEVSAFVPCGSAEQWWLNAAEGSDFFDQYRAIASTVSPPPGDYVTVFVRFTGTLSPPGSYGHLGAYQREVTAETVLDMNLDGTC